MDKDGFVGIIVMSDTWTTAQFLARIAESSIDRKKLKKDFEKFYLKKIKKPLKFWIVYSSCVFAMTAAC
jgi:hypothetical protein